MLGTRILTGFVLALWLLVAGPAFAQEGTGTLQFVANGEDFVRQGFTSKDGWAITFDALIISLDDIIAYQSDPPYDPDSGPDVEAEVSVLLDGPLTVDLAEGDADADPIPVGEVEAPPGRYNALAWRMIPAEEGEAEGYSLLLVGNAERDGDTIQFRIGIENEYQYVCGEYVGDERKGILGAGDTADLEMTFHFDHLFGDAELPPDDDLNTAAPGFALFAGLAEDGVVDVNLAMLESALDADEYQAFVDILPTLGHTGEGHCYETSAHDHETDE